MPSRDPAVASKYLEYQRTAPAACPFCDLGDREVIASYDGFIVLRALFPYSEWDGRKVREHLMAVPKRHVEKFAQLDTAESAQLLTLFTEYEDRGYSIYARAPQDSTRSVTHQHSHLLLLSR